MFADVTEFGSEHQSLGVVDPFACPGMDGFPEDQLPFSEEASQDLQSVPESSPTANDPWGWGVSVASVPKKKKKKK